jgi:hypothetical protein
MQSLGAVTTANLLRSDQQILQKFEIYVSSSWIDLCSFGSKNYVKGLSMKLAGAGPMPDPIAGSWSATLVNDDNIFHPNHPTSSYKDYIRTGRKVRISLGAKYGATSYYWQRMIGYMDAPRFDAAAKEISISGSDYMQRLTDFTLKDGENYWGDSETYSSAATEEVLGAEQYTHTDALKISLDYNSMAGWTAEIPGDLTSQTEGGGGSTYVAQLYKPIDLYSHSAYIDSIGTLTAGNVYRVTFKYRIYAGAGTPTMNFRLYASGASTNLMGGVNGLDSWSWTTVSFLVTANASSARIFIEAYDITMAACGFQMDVLSIKEVTSHTNTKYSLPADCNGPYLVTLNTGGGATPVFFNDPPEKYGWLYNETTRILEFVEGVTIDVGSSNLVIYYYTTELVEHAVARILKDAGLYASESAALSDMDYTATGVYIDRLWFEAGTMAVDAIRLLCERVNYRFWFGYDGKPYFKPAPTLGSADFTFTAFGQIASAITFEDLNEISNAIIIEGMEQGMYSTNESNKSSRLTHTAEDSSSIGNYNEHSMTITNHLFQTQAAVDAMADTVLAAFKDPKWYFDMDISFNPVPLEMGDVVGWRVDLSTGSGVLYGEFKYAEGKYGVSETHVDLTGIIRDISIEDGRVKYTVEQGS